MNKIRELLKYMYDSFFRRKKDNRMIIFDENGEQIMGKIKIIKNNSKICPYTLMLINEKINLTQKELLKLQDEINQTIVDDEKLIEEI